MTIQINVAEAKAKLSELIARAEAGEEVIIARAGKPSVTLRPVETMPSTGKRQLGIWAHLGKLKDPDLFIGPDPETLAEVDGPIFPPE